MKRLFIIGNGFDIYHGMQTRYSDFKNYFKKNSLSDYKKFCDLYEPYSIELWSDLEGTLGKLEYQDDLLEKFFDLLRLDYGYNWRESDNFDFQYEVEDSLETIDIMKDNMNLWIRAFNYDFPSKLQFNSNDEFLTFNYTITLEQVYKILDSRILHIHNKVDNDIILGHKSYNTVISNHHDLCYCDFRIEQSIEYFEQFMESRRKHTEDLIDENIKFFERKYDEIIVIGHSMNEVDFEYYKQLSYANKNSNWVFAYYSKRDKENYINGCSKLGIEHYKLFKYNELEKYLKETKMVN